MRRLALALLPATLLACASSRRLDTIDTRLSAVEANQARSERRLHDDLARLSEGLERLISDLRQAQSEAPDAAVGAKLDAIVARLEQIERDLKTRPSPSRRREPSATDVYAVPIDGAPSEGPAEALVTIVRAYEYACPFCEKVRPTLDEIQKKYPKDVRIVYKQFIVHPQVATAAALAVCAAHKQGKFEKMDELVWEKAFKTRQFEEAHFADLAKEAGLDVSRFNADVKGDCNAFIQKDQQELQTFGVGATPAFFINGRFLSGAQPLPAFDALVSEELKKANDRIAQGTAPADYYKTWVIEKGLKKLEAPKAEAVAPH